MQWSMCIFFDIYVSKYVKILLCSVKKKYLNSISGIFCQIFRWRSLYESYPLYHAGTFFWDKWTRYLPKLWNRDSANNNMPRSSSQYTMLLIFPSNIFQFFCLLSWARTSKNLSNYSFILFDRLFWIYGLLGC